MSTGKQGLRLLGALAALTAAAPARSVGPAGPSVRIGVSLGLSGAYAAITHMQEKAYRLWERHVNERGGIMGRPVEVIVRDDRSDPEVAKTIYTDFVFNDKVDFVFGPYSSAITAAVLEIAEKPGYPMLASGAASDELWKRGHANLFGVIPSAARYANGFLVILSKKRIDRIALVHADDAFSNSVADGVRRWSAEYGLKIVSDLKIVKGTAELDRPAEAARRSGAEVLVMAGHFEESVNMRQALRRIAWTPVAYYASIGPGLDAYRDLLGAEAEGTFSTSIWEAREDLKLPGSAEFLRAFLRAYGERPSYQAAQAYASGQILEQAIRKAGSLDRAAVRSALSRLDTSSLVGRYVVDKTGAQMKRFPFITQWQRGRREIVWPPELQTAPAVFADQR